MDPVIQAIDLGDRWWLGWFGRGNYRELWWETSH